MDRSPTENAARTPSGPTGTGDGSRVNASRRSRKRVRHPDAVRDERRKRWERLRMPLYTTLVVVGTFIGIIVLLDAVARGGSGLPRP